MRYLLLSRILNSYCRIKHLERSSRGMVVHLYHTEAAIIISRRPVIPLMLWKPQEPVYPRLIKTTIDGLSIEETKEMRKRGLAVPALTKLGTICFFLLASGIWYVFIWLFIAN